MSALTIRRRKLWRACIVIAGTTAGTATTQAHAIPAVQTPGLTLMAEESPGWRCDSLDQRLLTVRRAIWLNWLIRQRPRNLDEYKGPDRARGLADTNEFPRRSVDQYTSAVQAAIWREWIEPVVVEARICAGATLPPESPENCVNASDSIAIVKSNREWLIGATALESIIRAGQRLIPDDCPRNNYRLRFVFSPVRESPQRVVEAAVLALKDGDPVIRARAAEALGTMGSVARSAKSPLKRCLRDPAASVRDAAKTALARINE